MKILKENLQAALQLAVRVQEEEERKIVPKFPGESALLVGWKMVLKTLQDGESLEIV